LEIKNIYEVYAKIFHCSNINTDSPLSSNGDELEKYHLRNLRVTQYCCFPGWQVWSLQTCQPKTHPRRPVYWK